MAEENNETTEDTSAEETTTVEETTEATPQETTETTEETKDAPTKLVENIEESKTKLTDATDIDVSEIPAEFLTEDGKLNKDGVKKYVEDSKTEKEKYEERILNLRKKLSNTDAPEEKDAYFQDFAPEEKFMKYFVDETPEATKEIMGDVMNNLAETYSENGLSRAQADDISKQVLNIMEKVGVLDTRTPEQVALAEQQYVKKEMEKLGPNAGNIITEAKVFIHNAPFSAKVKNYMIDMMNTQGADFVDVVHQLKDGFGQGTGGVPGSVASLQGLPSDDALAKEYKDPGTTDARKNEILIQRRKAGRQGKLKF